MSERDEKTMKAMAEYDAAAMGTPAQTQAGVRLEKAAAGISERGLLADQGRVRAPRAGGGKGDTMSKRNADGEYKALQGLVGKQVDAYHDGKASPSRLVRVVVESVICRDEFTKHARRLWRDALRKDFEGVFEGCTYYSLGGDRETKQFWDWNCDTFITGHILNDDRTIRDPMLFARLPEGCGWYGVNWNYCLDLGGRVRRRDRKTWAYSAEERGLRMVWNPDAGKYHYFDKRTGRKVEE